MTATPTRIIGIASLLASFVLIFYTVIMEKSQVGLSDREALILISDFILFFGGIGLILWTASPNARRRLLRIFIPICGVLVIGGIVCKLNQWPTAAIQLILGVFMYSFIVGPIVARMRYEKWKDHTSSTGKLLGIMLADSMGFAMVGLGLLFWIQKWPLAMVLVFCGLLLLVAASILWNNAIDGLFSLQRATNKKLEAAFGELDKSHAQLSEKNKEITDSITYAKRIQEAILPPNRLVQQYLANSFILYKPKDIVAGDFYWMESVQGGVLRRAAEGGGSKIHNLPELKTFRKELRNNGTPAEAKLWTMLQKKQLDGRKFRRQHSIGKYIVDFYCPSEQLAIELDGEYHNTVTQQQYDDERTAFIQMFGIKVIRFENKAVFDHPELVLGGIREEFGWQDVVENPPRLPRADTPPSGGEPQGVKPASGLTDQVEGPSQGNITLFAAADCTGHGVPGAMVSVVCSNALNRAVREFGLTEPAKILDKTLELVIERFEKSEEEVKDGMDISLCALNTSTNELQWAGAHNPLWIVKKGASEIEEIKADKQPIGKYADPKPFTNHTIKLETGDCLYIFSDGYPDQFGGPKGKKLKTKAFKELILSIQDRPIAEQRTIINDHFETWRGDLEQLDDVCVIGVRI